MFYGHYYAHGRLNSPSDLQKVMKRNERWNTLQKCPHRDSNWSGGDLWSKALPTRPRRRALSLFIYIYIYIYIYIPPLTHIHDTVQTKFFGTVHLSIQSHLFCDVWPKNQTKTRYRTSDGLLQDTDLQMMSFNDEFVLGGGWYSNKNTKHHISF